MQDLQPPGPSGLAQGNRLQRAYYRWARPHYERIGRLDPELRERVEMTDRFLYSRQGLAAWAAWLVAAAACALSLRHLGLPWWLAAVLSLLGCGAIALVLMVAWLQPEKVLAGRGGLRMMGDVLVWTLLGGLTGYTLGYALKHEGLDLGAYAAALAGSLQLLLPAVAATGVGLALLLWAVASLTAKVQAGRLTAATLRAQRDSARADAAEAQLQLLQAQVQPHFVFNTLATLQHWVDRQDPRAGPLLRELTGFLRQSTEMLGRRTVPLAEEAAAAQRYLAIMQARMGHRLRCQVELDARCARQMLPPGLLLTMVENAVEHGLEPKIGGGSLQVRCGCEGRGWWLRVDDDGLGPAPGAPPGVGLGNLTRRLRQHYGDRARFTLQPRSEGGARAQIVFEDAPCPAS